jgi:GT2 family glycosyltransferase
VYVDAASPPAVRRALEAASRTRRFHLIRVDRQLAPNQARNLGLREATTPFVVFIDNDVVPDDGWLDALLRCADETGAMAVGPLYYIGEPGAGIVHMAGGEARIEESNGRRRFVEQHRWANRPVAEVRDRLRREESGHVEFHCMLVRREVFDRLGPLDERLLSMAEHTDLCFGIREHGGTVYFEPAASVTYVTTGRLTLADLRFFARRWSEAWTEPTLARVAEKWKLDPAERSITRLRLFARGHRQSLMDHVEGRLVRALGWRLGHWLAVALAALEIRVSRRLPRPPRLDVL